MPNPKPIHADPMIEAWLDIAELAKLAGVDRETLRRNATRHGGSKRWGRVSKISRDYLREKEPEIYAALLQARAMQEEQ